MPRMRPFPFPKSSEREPMERWTSSRCTERRCRTMKWRLEVIAWNETAENMWGVAAKEAQGQSIYDLGIGLPLDKLDTQIRACLNGNKDNKEHVLQAVNRRGKPMACRVTCKSFIGA